MKTLIVETKTKIRFSEVDSMGVVWHGSYVKYFEDAREAFGEKFGLGYLFVFNNGFFTPLVSLDLKYKSVIKYGDEIIIKAELIDTPAAKIIFDYEIRNAKTDEICTTGRSIQAFLDHKYNLTLYPPQFYIDWKKQFE